jgi:hypothetical protein
MSRKGEHMRLPWQAWWHAAMQAISVAGVIIHSRKGSMPEVWLPCIGACIMACLRTCCSP